MSGFAGALFPQAIQLSRVPAPAEGPKVVPVAINWQTVYNNTGGFIATINLLAQFQSGQFSTVQSLYIDNQTCPEMVTFTCADTGQQIRVPPFSKGMYPIFASQAPEFTVQLNLSFDPVYGQAPSAVSTRLFFLNVEQDYFEATPINWGQNYNYYQELIPFGPAQTVPLSGNTGSGLISLGNNQIYAFTSLAVTLQAISGFASVTNGTVSLIENGSVSRTRWQDGFTTSTTPGIVYQRQFLFPTPLFQIDPFSYWSLHVYPVTTGTANLQAYVNITYATVTIQ